LLPIVLLLSAKCFKLNELSVDEFSGNDGEKKRYIGSHDLPCKTQNHTVESTALAPHGRPPRVPAVEQEAFGSWEPSTQRAWKSWDKVGLG
jgi:hypothetical protein